MTTPEHPQPSPDTREVPSTKRARHGDARSAAQWRQLLRDDPPPEHLEELPYFRRRRARKAWRSARREARTQWVRTERRNVPTPVTVPIVALVVAGLVAGAAWLWPDQEHNGGRTDAASAPTAPAAPTLSSTAEPTPSASATVAVPATPDEIAHSFVTAYTTRKPAQDGTHAASVQRASPFASTALVDNLRRHDDLDFNQLVAAQATSATPSQVTIGRPPAADRPAPDTSIRIYRQATVRIDVEGTDDYSYTRQLTLEVSRADVGQPWMVTRVLGVEETP